MARGKNAETKLTKWREQALPTDLDVAKSLYQDWLRQQLLAAGLKIDELNATLSHRQSSRFKQLSFNVDTKGTLNQITKFLHQFYKAPHLHRISRATLTPSDDRQSVSLSITIDALSLPENDRSDQLAQGDGDPELAPLDQVQEHICDRNVFSLPQSKPDTSAAENAAKQANEKLVEQARVTRLVYGQEGWQMAILMEQDKKILYFRIGDPIQIGPFEGTVADLDSRKVVIDTKSGKMVVRLGDNLGQAQLLATPES